MTPERLAQMQASATRPRRTVPIVLDGDLRQQVEELVFERDELEKAAQPEADRRLGSKPAVNPRVAEIDDELATLSMKAEDATLHVVVEGLPGTPMAVIRAAHPPRKDNRGDLAWNVNVESAQPDLIRATVIGHRDGDQIHPVDVAWLLGWATEYQLTILAIAALSTSRGDDAVPLPLPHSTTETSADE